ncbi:hypothetical protein [Sulfurivirga sp.]|uniref:hypothetical protein n=1 Tax=Sulfurivirga sp. TaxID=2614236 RepID=UPI0025F699FB|nr:hypothetical protein [Sulfurivirga sp.]
MPIDLSQVDPLKPKKALLEAAMAQQQRRNGMADMEPQQDEIPPDLQWLVEDKKAVHDLVRQMDAAIGELARQLRQAETVSRNGGKQLESQQKLLYKQIHTLNGLMKRQIEAFELINRKVEKIHIAEQTVLPQLAMGLVGGLVAGVTVAVTLPWVQLLMARLTQ